MVEQAAKAGAKFAKIQTFFADDLKNDWMDKYDHYKLMELDWDAHEKFLLWCRSYGITPMTSVYSPKYLSQLKQIGFEYIKIGSADAYNEHLIRLAGVHGLKAFISTGGQSEKDIPQGFNFVEAYFHCVSKYPAHYSDANLSRFIRMKEVFPKYKIGFSDHTDPVGEFGDMPAMVASALGAAYIEKHFTILDRSLTKDGPVSISPIQLKTLCNFHNRTEEYKLNMIPHIPITMFKETLDQGQKDLIRKYQTRWKG